jgi:hypothetical protein
MTIVARLTLRSRCMVEHNNNQRDSHHVHHDVVELHAGSMDRVCDAHLIELCIYQEDRWSSCWVAKQHKVELLVWHGFHAGIFILLTTLLEFNSPR